MFTTSVLIIGALISLAGGIGYIRDTLHGKAKPNRVTWTLWAVAPLIAFAAQISQGVGLHALQTFMVGFVPLLILIASFIGHNAKWELTRFDIVCGAIAVVGLVLWQLMDNAVYAVALSILADLAAGIPTLVKAYRHPETESAKAFATGIINAGLTLAVTSKWSFVAVAFPIYIVLINSTLVTFIHLPRVKRAI